jgi:hypothetical protein
MLVDKQAWHDDALLRGSAEEPASPLTPEEWKRGFSEWHEARLDREVEQS